MLVIKRHDEQTTFNTNKIFNAIKKAFEATDTPFDDSIINLLVLQVTSSFSKKVVDNKIHVEDIQDAVEHVLEISFVIVRKKL